jgi:hypothetical protein
MSYSFKDDPFVCPECRKAGYCIERAKSKTQLYVEISELEDTDIVKYVPVKTTIKEASTKFGKKLQQAHDLFHQDEYEQASYLYADMIASRNDCNEVIIGLAASFFFLKKYDDAASVILKLGYWYGDGFQDKFIRLCELKTISEKEEIFTTEIKNQTEQQKAITL